MQGASKDGSLSRTEQGGEEGGWQRDAEGLGLGKGSTANGPRAPLCPPPGLSLVVGLVLYISSINDEVMNRPSSSEQYFHYRYGWSFAFAASSFLLKEVMSVGPGLRSFECGWGLARGSGSWGGGVGHASGAQVEEEAAGVDSEFKGGGG